LQAAPYQKQKYILFDSAGQRQAGCVSSLLSDIIQFRQLTASDQRRRADLNGHVKLEQGDRVARLTLFKLNVARMP
jgi:hypothetical protein